MSLAQGASVKYAEKFLGGHVVPYIENPVSVAGVVQVLAPDPERVLFYVSNLSPNTMYVGFTPSVSATNGILLSGNGGYVSMNVTEDFEMLTLPIYIATGVAGNQLYIVNMRREFITEE